MSHGAGAGAQEAPLEDLMVAMDVVDTVRHRELLVDRQLDAEGRRQRLLARLREIYAAQGIAVTDAALEAGVEALEQERFAYVPPPGGLATWLAQIYVRRDRWLKPLLGLFALLLLAWLAWYLTVARPASQQRAALPAEIETAHARIRSISKSEEASRRADELLGQARSAVADDRHEAAQSRLDELQALRAELESSYEVRIVSRPNELSGVWRVPDINPDARNYYLIVEAVDAKGNVLTRRVRNEEDGSSHLVTKWGLRVSEETFEAVAADKRDDGIIEDSVVGSKPAGRLAPEYRVPTSGATITEW